MDKKKNFDLCIKAFRAAEKHEECLKYADGHLKVLKNVGVTQVTSAKLEWIDNPNVYVISVENKVDGKILGGARVHVKDSSHRLPIEDAVYELDESIFDRVLKDSIDGGTGELCGLWNSREVAGLGLGSMYLTRAGVAITSQLCLKSLYGLAASYTVKMSQKVGYEIITSLGKNGTFYYPKTDFLAYAIKIFDPETLSKAEKEDRDYIFELRNNLTQTRIEDGRMGKLCINFELKI